MSPEFANLAQAPLGTSP